MSLYVARSSTLDIWRRRSRPPMPSVSRWRRAHGSSPSTICRRPRDRPPPTRSSGPARRPRTRASGFWTTAWSRTGFAGSGPATRGSTTAATFSRWSRSARSWRGSPSMPRPAPRRRASTTSSSGSRPRGGWCASTRRGRRRCTAARCSAPASWRPCGRSQTSSGSAGCGGSRPTGSCSSAGRPKPAPTSCTSTAPRSA